MPTVVCPVCSKSFHVFDAHLRKYKAPPCCSRKCRGEFWRKHPKPDYSKHKTVKCACGCGETFRQNPTRKAFYKHGHGRTEHSKQAHMIPTTCAQCGKDIIVHQNRIARFPAVFCSRQCSGDYRRKPREYTCEHCGKWFKVKNFKQGKHTFCTSECFLAWRVLQPNSQIEVYCSGCQKPLKVYPSKFKLNKEFYCSVECRASHIQGENNPSYVHGESPAYYGPNWKSQRRKAVKRDNYQCQVCGKRPKKSKNLHVHHIKKVVYFTDKRKANYLKNLITLCHLCHKKAERGDIAVPTRLL